MSITFSSSENNYWCFFFIIIATRRKRRTQRDSETRERNEEKRTFCDRKTDELRRRFYHPRPFRRRLRNDLRYHYHILLHHRSTSRSRRRTHSARARAFFSFFSYLRYKNEKRDRRAQTHDLSFVIRDRSDDAFGPISSLFELVLWSSSLDVEKPKKNP